MTAQPSFLQGFFKFISVPFSSGPTLNSDTIHLSSRDLKVRDSEKSYLEMAGDVIGCVKQFFEPLWVTRFTSISFPPLNSDTIHLSHLRSRDLEVRDYSEKDYLIRFVALGGVLFATGVCAALILKFIANQSKTTSLDGRITTV
jgi:hypothetical protein